MEKLYFYGPGWIRTQDTYTSLKKLKSQITSYRFSKNHNTLNTTHVFKSECPSPLWTLTQFNVCCDPDHVPVCDQPHEAGIPGGEQPSAPTSPLPEGQTRQEEHSAMRCLFSQPQLRLFILQHRDVFMYILYLLSPFLHGSCLAQSLFAILSQQIRKKKKTKHAVTFNKALYFWT